MSVGLEIILLVNPSVSPWKGAVCWLLLPCSACSGRVKPCLAAAVAAFQANLCPVAGSRDLPQGSTCQSPAACRYKAPCRSLAAISPKNYSKY